MAVRIGVDIGGTFTDAVAIDGRGGIRTAKALSTPGRLADGVISAIERLGVDLREVDTLTHGTTAGISGWLSLLVAFDAAFLATGYIVFGHLLED